MSVLTRLRDLFDEILTSEEPGPHQDVRVSVATLLMLVAQADGRVLQVEEEGLRNLLRSRFELSHEQIGKVLAEAASVADSLDPAVTLSERISQEIGTEARKSILAMAYRIAALDGYLHEFEDDLLWRIGRLLGFSDAENASVRAVALNGLNIGARP
jgi:uncharacterized tellurite resistance protein B-like protein